MRSEFDPGAGDFLEANQTLLRPLFADDLWARFQQLLQNYAFSDAQTLLDQAVARLPSP